ncbi:MAG: TolC family protein [Myxococcales bacterium]
MPRRPTIACSCSLAFAISVAVLPVGAAATEPEADGAERLTRLDAIRRGVEKNLSLVAQRLDLRRTQLLSRAAWQPYSPSLVIDAEYSKAQADAPGLGREHVLGYGVGVSMKTPVGTSLNASLALDQGLGGGGTAAGGANGTATEGKVSLGLTQPLLKGGWLAGAALPLREAELLSRIQRELFRDELNRLIASVEAAYWDLAVAEADLAIKTRSRDRAKQQFEDTAENIRRGILAPGEIYVVEENVVFFEQELVRADQTLRLARHRLAAMLRLPADTLLGARDALEGSEVDLPQRAQAIDTGLRESPTVAAQTLRCELSNARLENASNLSLPSLDLSASLSLNGSDEAYAEAWRKVFAEPQLEGRVGLVFGVPLDRAAVRAGVDGAALEAQRNQTQLENAQVEVRFDVDDNLSELQSSVRLLGLSQKSVELAELKLQAETDKYKLGLATLADLVRFQRDLDNALIGLQRLHRAVRTGRSRLLQSQGTLHQSVGVEVR